MQKPNVAPTIVDLPKQPNKEKRNPAPKGKLYVQWRRRVCEVNFSADLDLIFELQRHPSTSESIK